MRSLARRSRWKIPQTLEKTSDKLPRIVYAQLVYALRGVCLLNGGIGTGSAARIKIKNNEGEVKWN